MGKAKIKRKNKTKVKPKKAAKKISPKRKKIKILQKKEGGAKLIKKASAEKIKIHEKATKPNPITAVYLGLGSNVGDREEYIEQAISLLKETPGIKVIRRASNFETEAEGKTPQPLFINSAVEISTDLPPAKLLEVTQSIEDTLGRERGVEWGPRIIDIDILLYGDTVVSDNDLTIPHALMHERIFVLEPLKQIAPHVIHPMFDRTISELFEDKKSEGAENYDDRFQGFERAKRGLTDDFDH